MFDIYQAVITKFLMLRATNTIWIKLEQDHYSLFTDVTSSGTKNKPILSDQITCMANQYDEQSKDPVIDDARKTDQQYVPGYVAEFFTRMR